jgi:hypothetical protein
MLTQRVTVPAYQPVPRLRAPLTTWRHLAIIVKHYAIPGEVATVLSQAVIDYQTRFANYFPRQVDEFSRGRCAVAQTVYVPSLTLTQATPFGGALWIAPQDLIDTGIWAASGAAGYDSVAVYADYVGCPMNYAGLTVAGEPGLSHVGQMAWGYSDAALALESISVHEWLHQVEGWFESANGGAHTITDLHGGEVRINPRTGVFYVGPWWDYYQDMMTAKVSSGPDLPGITDAIWASGRPVT